MKENCYVAFARAVKSLPEMYRDIIATSLGEFIRNPDGWGCPEDGTYALFLFLTMDFIGENRYRKEFDPASNGDVILRSLKHCFFNDFFTPEVEDVLSNL